MCQKNASLNNMVKYAKIMQCWMRYKGVFNISADIAGVYILITNLMHWLLFIHKILFSSTCFEPQVVIFRRIQLYTCSIWYCHSLRQFVVACQYTAWVRTDCRGKVVGRVSYTDRPPRTVIESDSIICCMYTTVSSWRWALEARNM